MRAFIAWLALAGAITPVSADAVDTSAAERPCTKSDMIGTWVLDELKHRPGLPASFDDLKAPYQARMYLSDGDFRKLSSSRELTPSQTRELLSTTQNRSFELQGDAVATKGSQQQVLETYQCRFYVADVPELGIKKGTLSLLWFTPQSGPLVLQTYTPLPNGTPTPRSGPEVHK